MKVIIDLSGLKTEEEVLLKFGEVFKFGNWGVNWDALEDSMRYIEDMNEDVWGKNKKIKFPLEIDVLNYKKFKDKNPEGFKILKDIFNNLIKEYAQEKKVLRVQYK